ncbi:sugar ABC transporter permease [Marvinbryantia formatexigens DSM 14469]|nr:sugar ABC transporter permease [Marvinbryantia formatexigens]UWO26469.1 sugar ABC transporter permease [Marvinbryantia formatexigens DSM 14469]
MDSDRAEGGSKVKYTALSRKRRKRENRWGLLFCLPCILGFLFFAFLPMCTSFFYSFTDYNVISKCNFVGLDNYKNMFSGADPYFYKSLFVTVVYVALSVPSSLITAFLVAMLLNSEVKGKGIFRTIFYLPSIVPVVGMSAVWLWIFNSDFGLANMLLKAVGLPTCQWLSSETTVIPTLVFTNLWTIGSTMVIFLAGIQDVPRQLTEAVEIDGGGGLAKLFHVIIPMMTPTIFYNLVMGIINGFQIFTQAYVITQGGPNNASLFYVYYLYREAFQFMRMGSACAIAWVLFVIIMALTVIMFWLQKKWVYYGGE